MKHETSAKEKREEWMDENPTQKLAMEKKKKCEREGKEEGKKGVWFSWCNL
jgi:hypothetical protein